MRVLKATVNSTTQQSVWLTWTWEQFWVYTTPQEFHTPNFLFKNIMSCRQIQRTESYLLLQKVAAAQRLVFSCCCPSAPFCPLAQSDRRNWFSLFSDLCCPGPRNCSFFRLLYNKWISSSILVGRRFAVQSLPSPCQPLAPGQTVLRVKEFL